MKLKLYGIWRASAACRLDSLYEGQPDASVRWHRLERDHVGDRRHHRRDADLAVAGDADRQSAVQERRAADHADRQERRDVGHDARSTYTFEVATDSAFATKVYTKDGVPAGATTTALKIDKLTANKSYFWRARAQSGSLAGPNTEVRGFGIGPEVVLNQPVNGDPQPNATVGEQPTLNVNNVGRSGPNGPIFYRFEISETSAFGSLVYTATVAERTDLSFTGHAVTIKLAEKTYFWRVTATDPANAVTSTASAVSAMKVQPFNLQQATILDSPDNFAFFAETAKITTLVMGPSGINVDFTKKNGPDRWPDIFPPGFSGPIRSCLGMAWNIDGHWYASAPIEMWNDRPEGGGPPQEYALNWFYNPARWAPMTFHQPSPGETIGFFVVAGDVRGFNSNQKFQERSNVVLVPMPNGGGATYTFGNGVVASRR